MFNGAVDVGANDTVLIFVGAFTLSTQTVACSVGGFPKHSGYKLAISGVYQNVKERYFVVNGRLRSEMKNGVLFKRRFDREKMCVVVDIQKDVTNISSVGIWLDI